MDDWKDILEKDAYVDFYDQKNDPAVLQSLRNSGIVEFFRGVCGADADTMPLGAIGIYSATEKIRVGLQQLMAGARKWKTDLIGRFDLTSLTEECAKVTGIPYVMDAYRDEALRIIDG